MDIKSILVGFGIGLILLLVFYIAVTMKNARRKKEYNKEIARLKAMVTDRMEIETEGVAKLKKEVEELRKQNENLRISLTSMSQKPGRKEITRLHVYQQAADRLMLNSPGFGAAWQAALQESETDFAKTYAGIQPFIRKIIPLKTEATVVGEIEEK